MVVMSSVTLVAGYLAYSTGYDYFIKGPGKSFAYPDEIRKPLKDALFMKHRYPRVQDMTAASDLDVVAAKQRDAKTRALFTQAIEQARTIHKQGELKDELYAYLLVEYGDWLHGRHFARDAVDLYKEALRVMLHLPPGSPLPQLLQAKQRRYQFNENPESGVDTFQRKDNDIDSRMDLIAAIGMNIGNAFLDLKDLESAETVYTWCINSLLSSCIHSSKDLENMLRDPYSTCSSVRDQLFDCMDLLGEFYKHHKRVDDSIAVYQGLIRIATPPVKSSYSSDYGVSNLIQDTLEALVIMSEKDRWRQAKLACSFIALADLSMAKGDEENARLLVKKASRLNLPLYLVQKLPMTSQDQKYQYLVKELQSAIMHNMKVI